MKFKYHHRKKVSHRDYALHLMSMRMLNLYKLKNKSEHGTLRSLPSGFTVDQTWGALEKAWRGFEINNCDSDRYYQHNPDRMEYYAAVIQKLEHELGIKIHSFDDLKMSALTFYQKHAHELPDDVTGDEILEMMLNSDDKFWSKVKNEGSITVRE